MTELLLALCEATRAGGHSAELRLDEFPTDDDGCTFVVIPHEFQAWGGRWPGLSQRERTIALCTENAGTAWFEATYDVVPQFGVAVSINRASAAELQRRGIRCEHLQLGYTPHWDRWHGDESIERAIDVLYLGAADPRRDPLLASVGRELGKWNSQFLIPPLEPRTRPRPDFLLGEQKYERLRSAQILLNLHRKTSSALEWMRFLEAICNGCVVVSEPCRDGTPLIANEHYVAVDVAAMGHEVGRLLQEPERLRDIRQRSYDFVRRELAMTPAAVDRLQELAAELPRRPLASKPDSSATPRPQAPGARPAIEAATADSETDTPGAVAWQSAAAPADPARGGPLTLIASAIRRIVGQNSPRLPQRTPAYARAQPRVSVLCMSAPDGSQRLTDALESAAASRYTRLELLVAAPRAHDASAGAFLDGHPQLPAILLRSHSGQGAGAALNVLVEQARGEYVFVLNPTGSIHPTGLERLVGALDGSPDAFFAFPMVGLFEGERPVRLLGSIPWEPGRLKLGNWIDSMSLLRRSALVGLGGFSTDPRLAGWEAFDLWCRCAEFQGFGVHVPQVLAWHQDTPAADETDKWAALRERHPRLLEVSS
jgi:hypothetical protein